MRAASGRLAPGAGTYVCAPSLMQKRRALGGFAPSFGFAVARGAVVGRTMRIGVGDGGGPAFGADVGRAVGAAAVAGGAGVATAGATIAVASGGAVTVAIGVDSAAVVVVA